MTQQTLTLCLLGNDSSHGILEGSCTFTFMNEAASWDEVDDSSESGHQIVESSPFTLQLTLLYTQINFFPDN